MERSSDRVTYRCRLCRQQLFDGSCVLNTSTNHHQDVASTVPECLLDQSPPATIPTSNQIPPGEGQGTPKTFAFLSQHGRAGPSGTSNGVLAPYGQVTAGPNPLWFISEDATPSWVQRTLDKFQWKKGKLSCPKCHGRLGSFDFVTPYKLHCGSMKASRIHIMRSRVDCESSSPIVARIRPMPQSSSGTGNSHSYPSDGTAVSPSTERHSSGGEGSSPEMTDIDSAVLLSSPVFLPSPADSTSRHFLPETFSSTSDEEALASLPNSADYQRAAPVSLSGSHPVEQQRHYVSSTSRNSSMVTHIEQPHQSSSCRIGRPLSTFASQNNLTLQSAGLDQVRQRTIKTRVPVEKPVSFGLDSGHSRNDDSVAVSPPIERNVAYVSGTNRAKNRAGQVQNHMLVTQPNTSSGNLRQYRMDSQRHSQQQIWQYDNRSDELDDDDYDERLRYYPTHSSSNVSGSTTTVTHSRPVDISANIFKNTQAFLGPFITRGFSSDRSRAMTPAGGPSPSLYSQIIPSAEQLDRNSPTPREMRLPSTHTAQSMVGRDSEEDDEIAQTGDMLAADQSDALVRITRQRSPRDQRRERNRKKKERRKQRRYERWLERQTLGAEEESAIQDISAAGLYSLLGPRCAGSSLREVTTCSVCLDIYYQPYTCSPCEHIFCEPCLRQVTRFHPAVTPCPLCRTTIRSAKLHEQLTSAVKQLFPRQFENRHQMERRTVNRSFPLPGNSNLPPWYRMGYQNNRNQVDFLAARRNPGYVHDWGMRYLQGVVWRVVASTVVLLIVSGISVGFLHFMFDFS